MLSEDAEIACVSRIANIGTWHDKISVADLNKSSGSYSILKIDIDVLVTKDRDCWAWLQEFAKVSLGIVLAPDALSWIKHPQSCNDMGEIELWNIQERDLRIDEDVSWLTGICRSDGYIVTYELLRFSLLWALGDDLCIQDPLLVVLGLQHSQ